VILLVETWTVGLHNRGPSRYHGGVVRMSVDVKHRCDGHNEPTPRRVEQAFSFLGPPSHGQRCR